MFVWINWTYRCLKQLISSRCVKLSLRIYVHRLRNLAFQNKYKLTVISLTRIPPFFLKTDRYDHFFLADWPSLTRIRWLERVTENATFENAPPEQKIVKNVSIHHSSTQISIFENDLRSNNPLSPGLRMCTATIPGLKTCFMYYPLNCPCLINDSTAVLP